MLCPLPIFNGDRYSSQFEDCWQKILDPESGDCYLEGTTMFGRFLIENTRSLQIPCYTVLSKISWNLFCAQMYYYVRDITCLNVICSPPNRLQRDIPIKFVTRFLTISIWSKYLDDIWGARGAPLPLAR